MIRGLIRHISYNYSEGGLRQVIYKVFWRAGQWLWSRTSLYVYAIRTAEWSAPASRISLDCRQLNFEDLEQQGYFKARLFPEAMRQRLASGTRCHGFFVGGRLANVAWTRRHELELEPDWELREHGCLSIFDCHTEAEFRGRGIYPESLSMLVRQAQAEGIGRVLIAVDPGNVPSIKGIERAGFVRQFLAVRRRRFGRRWFEQQPLEARSPAEGASAAR